jgi:16S rRNA (guanine(966)-N(2))-methyltransferase RsmD
MRVIAGTFRSRRLHTPRGTALRPTSDRLRETLFNILGSAVEDAVFVDAFAGTGAVGIEALSRGARQCIFIEQHRASIALLRRNLESLGLAMRRDVTSPTTTFPGTAELLAQDVIQGLKRLVARRIRSEIVFADPPYADHAAYDDVLDLLGRSELLARDGVAVLEHSRRHSLPTVVGHIERTRVVEQGDAALSFYRLLLAA